MVGCALGISAPVGWGKLYCISQRYVKYLHVQYHTDGPGHSQFRGVRDIHNTLTDPGGKSQGLLDLGLVE
jgi:hypothetical protein